MAKKKTARAEEGTEIVVERKKETVTDSSKATIREPAQSPPSPKPPQYSPEMPVEAKIEKPKSYKNLALAGLLILALALAYYFLTTSGTTFNRGNQIDQETFINKFEEADRIFIVMDARGVSDSETSDKILQCGVDFAGSTGMGGKNVTPLGIDPSACTAPDGTHELKECFSWLNSGLTIYITGGSPGASYYSNGMVVRVDKTYTTGTCGVHRA